MSLDKPLVSVIVPAYNTEKYIDKCLRSLMVQTYHEIEVIIIDDGSQDETVCICQKYEKADCRFSVVSKRNTGVSDSRNLGIDIARGKYLVFVDSDDYVADDYIEVLVNEMISQDVQMVCAEYYSVKDGDVVPHDSRIMLNQKTFIQFTEAINLLHVKDAFQGYLWNKIFIRDVVLEFNIRFDTRIKIWEDMLFCLTYLTKTKKISYVNKPIYYYVQRNDSAMNDVRVWNENTQVVALEEIWKVVRLIDGEFQEYVRDYYANELVGLLGKKMFQNRNIIKETIKIIDSLNAKLILKHKIKVSLFKYLEPLMVMYYK